MFLIQIKGKSRTIFLMNYSIQCHPFSNSTLPSSITVPSLNSALRFKVVFTACSCALAMLWQVLHESPVGLSCSFQLTWV